MQIFQDKYIKVQDIDVRYWQEGKQGPYLLLIHGIGACAEYWHKNIDALAKEYQVIALDLPGFGKSSKPKIDYSLEFYSQFLNEFLKALNIEQVYLAAHSLGGAVALLFALDHLNKVKKLILVDNVGFALQVIIFFRLMKLPIIGKCLTNLSRGLFAKALRTNVYFPDVITEELVDSIYPFVRQAAVQDTMLYIVKHNANLFGIKKSTLEPLWQRFNELKDLPILLFWGKQDRLLSYDIHVPIAKKLLPHIELCEIDQCGHLPQLEYPELVNQTMLEFLQNK